MIEVTCRYDGGSPVLAVTGPVQDDDLPLFRTVLDGTLDGGHRSITVDLSGATVTTPAVLRLCTRVGNRLRREGRRLDVVVGAAASGSASEADVAALQRELDGLRAAVASRATIEQAKGVLMSTVGCDADEAFALLVQQSQHENRKLREVAAELVARQSRQPVLGAVRPG